ncbi:hypothetical protein TTE1168 [Caldanaerobacter subterraneus subsp. tengcongensis MB4]|uniref:Uncharacterized protein n=1 Tax=Caldanaerobacter subterraneus subsp. tengcongensis (strain DSM 15242 / JCM 11007 / NBRC 100824 / MB4) TaxID=273068 RepID=Q8RAP1_CALS4|nr:hypothetical protein TTE1168 [Caldanaerobacter subterraneus subsp. tengcongensis MB4]
MHLELLSFRCIATFKNYKRKDGYILEKKVTYFNSYFGIFSNYITQYTYFFEYTA